MNIPDQLKQKKLTSYRTVNKRIIYSGAIYHVTQRAPGKESLFLEEGDYLYFLKIMKETTKKFALDIYAFALLPNHVHILLKITKENLSEGMKNLFERYANYFNIKYSRKGHVFCGRYRATLCNDEKYFIAASVYIHLNPVKARLSSTPEEYAWSSINLYKEGQKKTFINYQEILKTFDPDLNEARKIYWEILQKGKNQESSIKFEPTLTKKRVHAISGIVRKFKGGQQKEPDLEATIETFKHKKRVTTQSDKKARKYLIEQLIANGYSINEIAEKLGITRLTVSRILHSNDTFKV